MTWHVWWMYLVTEVVLSISPGPAVLFAISQGLRAGGWRGLWAAAGICSGNVVWFALSAVGIGAAILAAPNAFAAIKWLGAGYLFYLAILSILGHSSMLAKDDAAAGQSASSLGIWMRGVILQLTNPKALVFFVALLPQFVDPHEPVWPQILILGATSVVAEFPVLAVYAALAGRASTVAREHRFARAIDLAAAVLLIAAAVGVLLARDNASKPAQQQTPVANENSATLAAR